MELLDGVLAYRVLKSANLSTENEKFARATIKELTYKNMCEQLRKIFVDISAGQKSEGQQLAIKTEPTFEVTPDSEEAFMAIVLKDLIVTMGEVALVEALVVLVEALVALVEALVVLVEALVALEEALVLKALEVTIMHEIQVVLLMKVKEKVRTTEDQVMEL